MDVNDNDPVFKNTPYKFNVTEERPGGTFVGLVMVSIQKYDTVYFKWISNERSFYSKFMKKGTSNIEIKLLRKGHIQRLLPS